MPYTVFLYLVIFIAFTGVHLYASKIKRASLRMATKPIILLAILGFYLEYVHFAGAEPSLFLILAIVTSWLGDVLLIPSGKSWFTAGGIAFLISHLLFMLAYIEAGILFAALNPVTVILIVIVYAATVCAVFRLLRQHLPKSLFYSMFAYLLTNAAMNCFAWFRLLSGSCSFIFGFLTAIGALLFFISDCMLFFIRFDKKFRTRSHFLVMLTYSVGVFLIVFGLMMFA